MTSVRRSNSTLRANAIAWVAGATSLFTVSVAAAGQFNLYTVADTNVLMKVPEPFVGPSIAAVPIGVTQDGGGGPIRRIRGLAYDDARGVMYGMTREGNLVCVDLVTAATQFIASIPSVMNPPGSFWSGLAFDGIAVYTANTFGNQQFVKIPISTSASGPCGVVAGAPVLLGSMHFSSGFQPQILGLDFYPSTAPPPSGTNPVVGSLYGTNRNNDDIVLISNSGLVSFIPPGFNATIGVNNVQETAFHPTSGVLYTIHDHSSLSNNAALSSYDFSTGLATEIGELPFGIVEVVGGGNDTYGWGGLAFAPATCPPQVCPPVGTTSRAYRLTGNPNGVAWSWRISGPSLAADLCELNVPGVLPGAFGYNDVRAVSKAFEASINAHASGLGCTVNQLNGSAATSLLPVGLAFPIGCPGSPANSTLLTIRVGDPNATSPTWTLSVGPAGCVANCAVSSCTNPCSFNPDVVEIPLSGNDCNSNGVDDVLDLLQGTSIDVNGDGILDECQGTPCGSGGSCFLPHATPGCAVVACCESACGLDPFCCAVAWDAACAKLAQAVCATVIPGDLNGDAQVNGADLGMLLGAWGTPIADIDGNGTTDGADLAVLLGGWTG